MEGSTHMVTAAGVVRYFRIDRIVKEVEGAAAM